jgi:hypothetical protein
MAGVRRREVRIRSGFPVEILASVDELNIDFIEA